MTLEELEWLCLWVSRSWSSLTSLPVVSGICISIKRKTETLLCPDLPEHKDSFGWTLCRDKAFVIWIFGKRIIHRGVFLKINTIITNWIELKEWKGRYSTTEITRTCRWCRRKERWWEVGARWAWTAHEKSLVLWPKAFIKGVQNVRFV